VKLVEIASTNNEHVQEILSWFPATEVEFVLKEPRELQKGSNPILLFFSSPKKVIQEAMEKRQPVEAALNHWITKASELVRCFQRTRGQSRVFQVDVIEHHPSEFKQAIEELYGLKIKTNFKDDLVVDPVHQVLALQWVREHYDAGELFGILEASGTLLTNDTVEDVLLAEKAMGQYQQTTEVQNENELLLLQLHQVQEELESVLLEKKNLQELVENQSKIDESLDNLKKDFATKESELTTLQKEKDQLSQELSQLKTQKQADPEELNDLKEENELLLLQLHHVQEELESYYLELVDFKANGTSKNGQSTFTLEQDINSLTTYAAELEKKYKRILRSRTWKVLAPVREVGRLLKSIVRGKRVSRNAFPKRPTIMDQRFPLDSVITGDRRG